MGLGGFVNRVLALANLKLVWVDESGSGPKPGNRYDLGPEELDGMDRETRRILNLLHYTKSSTSSYNAEEYESAYHSIMIGGTRFAGQRDPGQRLEGVDFEFDGATVLDIGCNQGGMLMEVADRIKYGIGIDYDSRVVNAANRVSSHRRNENLGFFAFDVEQEKLELVRNLLPDAKVDIVFLLAVCMWVENWRELITFCASISDGLLFESNGTDEQQRDQEEYLKSTYGSVDLIRSTAPDDPQQKNRKLYLCAV